MVNGEQIEMRFSPGIPGSAHVRAQSHEDLMTAGIIIPVDQVTGRWGQEAGEEYRKWQVVRNRENIAFQDSMISRERVIGQEMLFAESAAIIGNVEIIVLNPQA